MTFEVVAARLSGPLDSLLLHVVDGVADERADGLTVLAYLLFNRPIYIFAGALRLLLGFLCPLLAKHAAFALDLARLGVCLGIGCVMLALGGTALVLVAEGVRVAPRRVSSLVAPRVQRPFVHRDKHFTRSLLLLLPLLVNLLCVPSCQS